MKKKKALLVVDVQNDFFPGGALGIPGGDKIIPALNKYLKFFSKKGFPVFASRDWHPIKTAHFRDFGGRWPVHCIHNSPGAQFHLKLKLPKSAILIYKGMDPLKDSYSVFHAEDECGRSFVNILKSLNIQELYIGGLATDYCVRFTAKDALKIGIRVKVLLDAVQGADLQKGDSENALKEVVKLGAKLVRIKDVIK